MRDRWKLIRAAQAITQAGGTQDQEVKWPGPIPITPPKAFSPEPSQTKAGVVLAFDNCLHGERWDSTVCLVWDIFNLRFDIV